MALPQNKMREAVFQILFCLDMGHAKEDEIVQLMMGELKITKKYAREAYLSAQAVFDAREDLDHLIAAVAKSYSLERIQRAERNILRLGVYELKNNPAIPPLVSIAEAIRLSNKFSTKEASKFINAILDAVMKGMQGEAVDQEAVREAIDNLAEPDNPVGN